MISIKQIIHRQHNDVKNSKIIEGKAVGFFTCDTDEPHPGLPRTNPSSGQGGPALYPLGHVASTS